ncbi:spermidine/putrescine ABC transporter substrate-binding protein [Tamilnaduibacter salinus]|uniref:Spermidine/putrescine ABC transporter substrate-binding protein n=2 Tax=Tamilnaduibacter salinus TaxID=1484056 RepID=A0A2A2HZ92_9GAMM|nr:spermidine/putrescine ABC transporter substrate-binding protein [Tamilnaduibacter salinus]
MNFGGKKMKRREVLLSLLMLLACTGSGTAEEGPEPLTVVTWGGAYEASQRAAYFEPFTEKTGIPVRAVQFDGSLASLRRHLAAGPPVEWDVIDLIRSDAQAGCREKLLEPIDPNLLEPAPDGTPARDDFMDDTITRCAITQLVFSTVIAYNEKAFPGRKPRSIKDFFDLEAFPGKRALRKAPVGLFEWALMSYGVPREQLYDLLSTERGFTLAFRRLNGIRDQLVWWTGGQEPVDMLVSGEVAMASGYNGRFFHARAVEGEPISVIWDGQLLGFNSWAIPMGTDQPDAAREFIRFATQTERMADQSSRISYGPTRKSAQAHLGLHKDTGVPMRPHMPTAPDHLTSAIHRDHAWYARTQALRERLFRRWLESSEATPSQP